MKKLTEDVYNKIKRCRHTEKAAWKRLAYLEDHVEKIYQDIDAIAENLVCCILKLTISDWKILVHSLPNNQNLRCKQ